MCCVHRSGAKNDDPYTKPLSKTPATMPAVIATVFLNSQGGRVAGQVLAVFGSQLSPGKFRSADTA